MRDAQSTLSFEDKYLRAGGAKGSEGKSGGGGGAKEGGGSEGMASADRIIPAPISDAAANALVDTAKTAHRALGLFGVVRYDFFLKDAGGAPEVVLNEPNTVPGSFAFYLFEPAGLPFAELADTLLGIAFAEAAARRADLVAVHAWQDATLEAPFQSLEPLTDWADVASDEQRVLSEALAGWKDKEPDVRVREVVVRERTARALVAVGLTAELLVVGHRHRRAFARLGATRGGSPGIFG